MPRTLATALAVLLSLAAWGCGEPSSGEPAIVAAPTTGPRTAGPLIVYAKQNPAGGGDPSARTIVAYDLGARREAASFNVAGVSQIPRLASRRIIVNLSRSIMSYAFDGSDGRELRRAPDDDHIIGIGVSPDETKVAVTEQRGEPCGPPDPATGTGTCRGYRAVTFIVVIDAADGRELLTVPQSDPRFAGYLGQAAVITWRDDGRGFVVEAYTYSEYYGGLATIMLDGSVTTHSFRAWPHLSPNGRYIADGPIAVCDLSSAIELHELVISDLDSGRTLATVNDPKLSLSLQDWAPDSSQFLYSTHALKPKPDATGCKTEDKTTETWQTLRVDGSPPALEQDPFSVRRRWYGERVVEYLCNGEPALTAWCVSDSPSPPGGYVPLDTYVGRKLIDRALDFGLIGFLDR